ncbi:MULTISPECIES: ADP compounds hydrolase NudE [unclassified Xanthomonas]|uniref:ADP compounds hydrolase NudE n=1 Tax=Xanthomonas rydalmerensis TaxID=3046274 RepID=UPI00192608EF|nr:ADP compounds hydrolase NudE [Xanthomonas sp. LMG 9002]
MPVIHAVRARSETAAERQVEELDLEFSNGERRVFHRLKAPGHGAVVVVPMLDAQTVLLVREYAAGVHRYELGLVKGRIDAGETPLQAADRELKEEAGYGARQLRVLRAMTLAPTYMSHQSWLVLAQDLYPERLAGDEPEELEVVPWKLAELDQLMLREDFSEGRSLAALFIAREWLGRAE